MSLVVSVLVQFGLYLYWKVKVCIGQTGTIFFFFNNAIFCLLFYSFSTSIYLTPFLCSLLFFVCLFVFFRYQLCEYKLEHLEQNFKATAERAWAADILLRDLTTILNEYRTATNQSNQKNAANADTLPIETGDDGGGGGGKKKNNNKKITKKMAKKMAKKTNKKTTKKTSKNTGKNTKSGGSSSSSSNISASPPTTASALIGYSRDDVRMQHVQNTLVRDICLVHCLVVLLLWSLSVYRSNDEKTGLDHVGGRGHTSILCFMFYLHDYYDQH